MFYETKNRNIQITRHNSFSFASHLHHEVEIRICTAGTFDVLCNGIRRTLYPGDIMIAFPNDIHEYFNTEYGEGYMLIFKPSVSDIMKSLVTLNRYENYISMKEIIPLFEELYSEFKNDRSMPVMYGYIHTITGKIFKHLPRAKNIQTSENDLLTDTLKYISENYTTHLTLNSVAKRMGVTHNHLSRVFSEKIPGGFCEYVNALRVQHACELLKNTDLSVYEVLYSSGFSTQRTFYRVFKAKTGTSPKEYKKLNS